MIRSILLSSAFLAAATIAGSAQDRTIIQDGPAIVRPEHRDVVIEKREPPVIVEKRKIETTGQGNCESKSVRTEGVEGSTTVTKRRCD
jgi:hypothetical protein